MIKTTILNLIDYIILIYKNENNLENLVKYIKKASDLY